MSDFTIDWGQVGNNGQTTTLQNGSNTLDVTVSTPTNSDHQEFDTATVSGETVLEARCVDDPVKTIITFGDPVSNIAFDLIDVDQGNGWDDKVTIVARDANGNIVPVTFSGLTHHDVSNNTVEGGGTSGANTSLTSSDNVQVSIAGPIASLEIILDDGASAHESGTVGIGAISFDEVGPPDGYVNGTSANDTIGAGFVDADGDAIDANDQIVPGEMLNDDIILSEGGDDTVYAGNGNDEVFAGTGDDVVYGQNGDDYLNGGEGNDMLFGGDGDDGIVGGAGDDKVEGSKGNDAIAGGDGTDDLWGGKNEDVISGGRGDDEIDAGDGDDLVFGGQGADTITGGAGNDTISGGSQDINENIDFNDLSAGDLVTTQFIDKGFTVTSSDPVNPVMVFDTSNPTGGDNDLATNNLGNVLILSEDRDPTDPDDNASGGSFIFDFENPANIVNLGLLDIEQGATIDLTFADGSTQSVSVAATADGGQFTQWLNADNVMQMTVTLPTSGAIDNLCFAMDADAGDGDDIINAGSGDDLVFGDAGNDTLFGNAGDDTLRGGTGDDTIYGDDGDVAPVRESFEWDLAGAGNDQNLGGFTQNTGNVDVTFSIASVQGGAETEFETDNQNIDDIVTDGDPADDNSSLSSTTNGQGNGANYELDFSASVENVSFNINDVDGDGVVRVLAFDANGDPIPVTLDGGSNVTILNGDTIDSNGGYQPDTSAEYSTTVSIAGPVSQIVIQHTQDGPNNSGINVTDVYFDALPAGASSTDGDDTIIGGAGADTLFGEGGDDTFVVASGADGDGDVIRGGAGPDDTADNDVLDLTGAGAVTIDQMADATDDGATTGTVTFEDGSTLQFSQIEEIIADNRPPEAVDDTFDTDEDTAVTFDPTANDSDPDGQPVTLDSFTQPDNGSVTQDPNTGALTYTPNENFNGADTFEVTIVDPDGLTSTSTVTVNVAPVNDDPVANDDSDTTDQGTPVTVFPLGNDTDTDIATNGDAIRIVDATVPADQGTVTFTDDSITFTPAVAFVGEAEISYTIADEAGATDDATVSVTVEDVLGPVDGLDTGEVMNPGYVDIEGDEIDGADGLDDTIFGNGGDDTINAGLGDDIVDGGDGADSIVGGAGDDTLDGGAGDDDIFVGGGDDAQGGSGDDVFGIDDTDPAGNINATIDGGSDGTDGTPDDDANGNEGDVLDLSDQTDDLTVDFDTDPEDGTVNGLDADAEADITFEEIEKVITGSGDDIVDGSDATGPINVETNDGSDEVTGGSGDDLIDTGEGEDFVFAGEGDDTIDSGEGNDVVFGDEGNDTIDGGAGDDQLFGDEGNDTITGGDGADLLVGGAGNDVLDGGDGDDDIFVGGMDQASGGDGDDVFALDPTDPGTSINIRIDGGSDGTTGDPADNANGNEGDVLDLSDATQDLDVTFEPNPEEGEVNGLDGDAGRDIAFEEIEKVVTGSGDDVIDGRDATGSIDVATGEGDDDITGGAGDDVIDAGDGSDTVEGGAGDDTINLGTNLDGTPDGDVDTVVLTDGSGNDVVENFDAPVVNPDGSLSGVDQLDVSGLTDADGNPVTTEDVTVSETPDGDAVLTFPNGESVTLVGVTPDQVDDIDELVAIGIPDGRDGIVEGTAAGELIDANYSGDPNGDFVDNNDALLPGEVGDDDIIQAGGGDDTVIAGAGDDEVFGGEGNDRIEGNTGDDQLFGEDGDDRIIGGVGDDTIEGGEGNDDLSGNVGNDTIDGGDGDDEIGGAEGNDTLLGGAGEDTITGGSGDDSIDGGADDDTIDAGSGDDVIEGGSGDDSIIGGDGSDTVTGGDGDDVINTSGHLPLLDLGFPGYPSTGVPPIPADFAPGNDIDFVDGGAGNDTIITGDDADTILGGDGNDTIDAGIDADTIDGGDGDDRIVGGEGSDTIDGGDGDDTIYAGLDPDLGLPDDLDIPDSGINQPADPEQNNGRDVVNGGAGNDMIFGQDDDDTLFGDEGDDFIDGGIDEDTISGGEGDDTIIGGEGADTLTGDSGEDTFLVGSAEEGSGDVIDGGQADGPVDDEIDTLDLTGSGNIKITFTSTDQEDGFVEFRDENDVTTGTLTFTEIENVIPCFTLGTTIATPKGERLVEELKVGDKIITRDNGLQEIRWLGAKTMDWKALSGNPHLKPILIRAGSLGNDLPERDMLVSPNHRVLVSNDKTALYFEEREVLAAAKHLVNNNGVHEVDTMGTTYIHFMFDQHEVVLSNGAWTESFQPGDYTLKGIGNAQRNEIFELFPELKNAEGVEGYRAARKTLKKHEAKLLIS
ncbi:MAG: Hint domain-containing protein [Pseudomonadota bacterium]